VFEIRSINLSRFIDPIDILFINARVEAVASDRESKVIKARLSIIDLISLSVPSRYFIEDDNYKTTLFNLYNDT